eukprot:1156168-Pelagomonas_calceolata.AAC.6
MPGKECVDLLPFASLHRECSATCVHCRGYMIAADHFGAALQPVPPGSPHPWACEWGVMGFGGNWSRVRAFFRADGWIDKWQTIQFFIH